MTDLQIRKIPFEFDESVPFQWNPANPDFGLLVNALSVLAIAFERYILGVTRQVLPRLSDPGIVEEAEAFLRQEGQHSRAHRLHVNALIRQYPGLRDVLDGAIADYDRLRERESPEFGIAYIAAVEATFTPLFKMMLDNRSTLFSPGDARVASLLVWHLVEEIEHRSSALVIYHGLIDDPWYRTRTAPRVFGHLTRLYGEVIEGFHRHVPPEDLQTDLRRINSKQAWVREAAVHLPLIGPRRRSSDRPTAFQAVPGRQLMVALLRLLLSQTPHHRPADEPLPAWAETWFAAYDEGADMTRFEGKPLRSAS
ncbi:metal-dependent hydrolase [Actinomadura sp. NPDC000600]|uniref:metal-dependent hydrolase n=1 Tax=Actinomadura sp. NPDC000600 TaxID=3154262 RepID=UPI00339316E2